MQSMVWGVFGIQGSKGWPAYRYCAQVSSLQCAHHFHMLFLLNLPSGLKYFDLVNVLTTTLQILLCKTHLMVMCWCWMSLLFHLLSSHMAHAYSSKVTAYAPPASLIEQQGHPARPSSRFAVKLVPCEVVPIVFSVFGDFHGGSFSLL